MEEHRENQLVHLFKLIAGGEVFRLLTFNNLVHTYTWFFQCIDRSVYAVAMHVTCNREQVYEATTSRG